jgi:hypothetical protein
VDDYLGEIIANSDTPGFSRSRWIELIQQHSNLQRGRPIEGINPFTREPLTYHPAPDSASVVVDDEDVGTMFWAPDESNTIVVCGEATVVIPVARSIAELLNGHFVERKS